MPHLNSKMCKQENSRSTVLDVVMELPRPHTVQVRVYPFVILQTLETGTHCQCSVTQGLDRESRAARKASRPRQDSNREILGP